MKLFCNLKQWQGDVFAVGKVGVGKKRQNVIMRPQEDSMYPWVMDGHKGRKGSVKIVEKMGHFPQCFLGNKMKIIFYFPNSANLFMESRGREAAGRVSVERFGTLSYAVHAPASLRQ